MAGIFPARILPILPPLPRQRVADRYAIAIASAFLAILLRWVLDPILGHVAFYVTLYITVTFCADRRCEAANYRTKCRFLRYLVHHGDILCGILRLRTCDPERPSRFPGTFLRVRRSPPFALAHPPARSSRHCWLLPGVRRAHRPRRGQPAQAVAPERDDSCSHHRGSRTETRRTRTAPGSRRIGAARGRAYRGTIASAG